MVSAKTGEGVENVFTLLATKLVKHFGGATVQSKGIVLP